MTEERKQILEMLAESKITADEAARLLDAIEQNANESAPTMSNGKKPKFLYVQVNGREGAKHENVNIKIPILILKAGMKLGALMPEDAKSKMSSHLGAHGINLDLNKLDSNEIDILTAALAETSIDVEADNETVKIYCA